MKKTIIVLAAFLPLASFAQDAVTLNIGKSHNCLSMGRGCLHSGSNSITFNVERSDENIIVFSISTVGISEDDQQFLIGEKSTNIEGGNFFYQEEDYYFSEREKNILNLKESAFLSKGKYPIKSIDERLYLEVKISYH